MNLAKQLLPQNADSSLGSDESARVRCEAAREFEEAGDYERARRALEDARRLYAGLEDRLRVAQVDEKLARVMLAEGKNIEAWRVAESLVETLEGVGEHSLFADALTTQATALARLGHHRRALAAFEKAFDVAHVAGDVERAGLAALALTEELDDHLDLRKLSEMALRAAELLDHSRDALILRRSNLSLCLALRLVEEKLDAFEALTSRRREGAREGRIVEEERRTSVWDWEDFSLWEDVRRYEARVIGRALRETGGRVSKAAQLLGFNHHNSLIALLNTRHRSLLPARSPIIRRRRSIIGGAHGSARSSAEGGKMRRIKILHVEDNEIVADAVRETLEVEGWRVESCADGAAALKLVESTTRFDLLLIDCELPNVGGVEIVAAARKLPHRERTPIIILSASDCLKEAHSAGANLFLRKPEDIHTLVEAIARLLKISSG